MLAAGSADCCLQGRTDTWHPCPAGIDTVAEAALVVNRDVWALWDIHFEPDQTPGIMSPFQVVVQIQILPVDTVNSGPPLEFPSSMPPSKFLPIF
jgi:hypothetical protein